MNTFSAVFILGLIVGAVVLVVRCWMNEVLIASLRDEGIWKEANARKAESEKEAALASLEEYKAHAERVMKAGEGLAASYVKALDQAAKEAQVARHEEAEWMRFAKHHTGVDFVTVEAAREALGQEMEAMRLRISKLQAGSREEREG